MKQTTLEHIEHQEQSVTRVTFSSRYAVDVHSLCGGDVSNVTEPRGVESGCSSWVCQHAIVPQAHQTDQEHITSLNVRGTNHEDEQLQPSMGLLRHAQINKL